MDILNITFTLLTHTVHTKASATWHLGAEELTGRHEASSIDQHLFATTSLWLTEIQLHVLELEL